MSGHLLSICATVILLMTTLVMTNLVIGQASHDGNCEQTGCRAKLPHETQPKTEPPARAHRSDEAREHRGETFPFAQSSRIVAVRDGRHPRYRKNLLVALRKRPPSHNRRRCSNVGCKVWGYVGLSNTWKVGQVATRPRNKDESARREIDIVQALTAQSRPQRSIVKSPVGIPVHTAAIKKNIAGTVN